MEMKLGQYQKQLQRLVMTPQMQQSIKLLQLNTLEMEQLTDQQMLENPFLELLDERESTTENPETHPKTGDDPSLTAPPASPDEKPAAEPESAEAIPQDLIRQPETFDKVDVDWNDVYDYAENKVYCQQEEYEEHDFTEYTSLATSLQEHLLRQVKLSPLEGKDVDIGEYIIGNLDEDGYLRTDLEEIAQRLSVTPEQVEDVLDVIQTFDPTGIAARNLAECLRLQLEDQDVRDSFIYRLIDEHLKDLQRKRFKEIARAMNVDEERVTKAFERISHLEPRPGRSFTKDEPQYVVPDVVVKKVDSKYMFFLNEGRTSRLGLNPYYRNLMMTNNMSKDEKAYAITKYRGALWLLKNIEKRKSTILRITEAIMNAQKEFLDKGLKHLKPLTLHEVADEVGMHESTVARVTTGKYVETPRGIFELKFFFSSGLKTENGESTSSTSVKEMIVRIIEEESPEKPYSDQKIVRMLEKNGIKIARRTVAKYRDQLKILPAKLRKKTS